MAGEDVDFAKLFATNNSDDDGMSNIDFQSGLNFLNMDDHYDALKEVNGPDPENCASKNAPPNESGILDTSQIHQVPQVLEEPHFSGLDLVNSGTRWSPFCLDVSDSWAGGSDSLFDSAVKSLRDDRKHENLGPQSLACSSPGDFFGDAFSFGEDDEICPKERTGVSSREIPANGVESSPLEAHSYGDNLNFGTWRGENESQLKHVGENAESENASLSSIIRNGELNFEGCVKNIIGGNSGNQENGSYTNFENSVMDADRSFPVASSANSTVGQDSRVPDNFIDCQLSSNCYLGTYGRPVVSDSSIRILPSQPWTNEEMMSNMKAENGKFNADMASTHMSRGMHSSTTGDISYQDGQIVLADSGYPSFSSGNVIFNGEISMPLSTYMSSRDQSFYVKSERKQQITPYQNNFHNGAAELNVGQEVKQLTSVFPSMGYQSNECFKNEDTYAVQTSAVSNNYQHIIDGTNSNFEGSVGNLNLKVVDRSLPHARAPIASENQFARVKRRDKEIIQHKHVDSEKVGNSLNISQSSKQVNSQLNMVGSNRRKACDERNILQVALQVLSQPKSEVSLPDGLLAVPLLRHQRIALSWMVQKETSCSYCSGGILADDQGLGKTVTTIALILKQRPPALTVCPNVQKGELEASNLSMNLLEQEKGGPSAGTLIVCPTSVLRQWAEELQNKVTSQANLSVLVYHGRNRTKDPYEVAKYDVVLTTYAIVSLEVPKQPIVNKDGEEKGIFEDYALPSRKRKYPSNSDMSGKKELDSTMLEAVSQPLAKVAWFRVVLDEAQSIKNRKTQFASACSDLHAKRRWCLSGTPIQNSIDDLYSYFKFLRYSPYDVYPSFCATIKIPISRSPTTGYRKLQAVLNTIMLRRTKGTLLDGEPIISLPPKFVKLEKVDFSREEHGFYLKLEADSRAQFKKYADAGTVLQNYSNILQMLLHLRQACDHPLLVKPYNSSSLWRSSVEMAENLPQEKQISLSKCLEASLALCVICNDPPEDAVVSVCGHVFCNQCIYDRLSGNDKQCPATNCKGRLNTASVFSNATLSNCFSNQDCDNSPCCSGCEVEESEPWSRSQSYESSKMKAALKVLKSSTVEGEKAIVFTQWTSMLDLLGVSLKNSSIQYRRLDGNMSVAARDKAIKDFNVLPEVSVMIMCLKAASLGLNLIVASHVLMLDLWWNPTTEDQAIDRAHRIGQTRPVTVVRLTVRDTVEDRILALQEKKRKVVAHAFGENDTGGRQSQLTVDELKCLFKI